jgi:biopolymer transport protein ExbB
MTDLPSMLLAFDVGGAWLYPILALALIALVLIIDKLFVYWRYGRLADDLVALVETYSFDWKMLTERATSTAASSR